MSASSAPYPKLIFVLSNSDRICQVIGQLQDLSVNGDQDEMRAMLAELAPVAALHRPSIRQVIASELQAAEVRHAAERGVATVARVLRREPQEHLHAANDEGQAPSPYQPSPSVA